MKYEFEKNGNLLISAEPSDKDFLEDLKVRHQGNDVAALADILEDTGWAPNGRLMLVAPEEIAALTDAPILTDDKVVNDDGSAEVPGRVWWFPDYMVVNFLDQLLEKGNTVFHAAQAVTN
jgi:hypothetical protein